MKKAEKEPSEIKADPAKSGQKTDPLTPEELREIYVMVKEIYHHLGLDGAAIRSLRESREYAAKHVKKWLEKQTRKRELQGKKE